MTEMATTYTTGEVDPQAQALLLKERDELRAALKERNEEIGLLNGTLESRNRNIEALHEVSAAQRKVLEQAFVRMDCARDILTGGKPRPECNWGMLDTSDIRHDITSIQEKTK